MKRKLILTLAGLALAGCGSAAPSATRLNIPHQTMPERGTAAEFIDAFGPYMNDLAAAGNHLGDASDLIREGDFNGAIEAADDATRAYTDLSLYARQMPGATTTLGVATIDAFDTCAAGSALSSYALDSLDEDDLGDAGAALGECSAAIDDVVEMID